MYVCLLVRAPFVKVLTFHLAALGFCKKKPPAICLLVGLCEEVLLVGASALVSAHLRLVGYCEEKPAICLLVGWCEEALTFRLPGRVGGLSAYWFVHVSSRY